MDYILDFFDTHLLNSCYQALHSSHILPTSLTYRLLNPSNLIRQFTSLSIMNGIGGICLYLVLATISYLVIFDKNNQHHPKFLHNQIAKEIKLSLVSLPLMSLLLTPFFILQINGFTKLYDFQNSLRFDDWSGFLSVGFMLISVPLYLLFTDMCIYWIHRYEHHPLIYAYIHKPHHAWKVPTPYASYAFHPVDGVLQALPYHIYPLFFPLHKGIYLAFFLFVMLWTVLIHDCTSFVHGSFVNGAAHHTVHHLEFNFNYGQYFTLWDVIGNTHKEPTPENSTVNQYKKPKYE